MDTPQYELSISRIEEEIVHFLVLEDLEMVGQLCEIWMESKGAESNHIGTPHLGKNSNIPSHFHLSGSNVEDSGHKTTAKAKSEHPSATLSNQGVA